MISSSLLNIESRSFDRHLAQEVSRSKTILALHHRDNTLCLPASPHKRFSDSEYHFRKMPEQTIHIMHIEKALSELFIMYWLNSLLTDAKFDFEIKSVLKELVNDYVKPLCRNNWHIKGLPDWFVEFLEDHGYQRENTIYSRDYSDDNTHTDITSFHDCKEMIPFIRIIAFAYGGKEIELNELFDSSSPYIEPPYHLWNYAYETLRYFVKDIQNGREEQHFRKKLDGMVARAYTTKRNIPPHILQEMKSSKLNQYFGFVEYDEDIDLTLVNAVIEEFIKLNRIYFHGFQSKDTAMRFRKLGRHKALGLYYPSLSTMVVDFRSPSSFVHEYFHMLDDILGNISLKSDFFRIVDRYQLVMTETVKKEEENGNLLLSKHSKYNLNYYLQKCEIFARCGEIHLFRNLHVVSSLLKHEDTHSFAYPDDEKLNVLIEEYYSTLLNQLSNRNMSGGEAYETALHIADH